MTGGRSFVALKTDGNSLYSSTPKVQVLFALPAAGGMPAGGAGETATARCEEESIPPEMKEKRLPPQKVKKSQPPDVSRSPLPPKK